PVAIERKLPMEHISKQGPAGVVRPGEVRLGREEPAERGIELRVLDQERILVPEALHLRERLNEAALVDRHVSLVTEQAGPLLVPVEESDGLVPFRRAEFVILLLVSEKIRVEDQHDGRPVWLEFEMAEVPVLHEASVIRAGAK